MTVEEAWLMWMKTTRKTSETATCDDFEVIKKTSWWAAFEAGWNAASCNNDVWSQAYQMGLDAGKEIAKEKNT